MIDSGRRYRHRSLRWCTTMRRRRRALEVDVLVANADGGRGRPMDTKASTLDPALMQLITEMSLSGTIHSCNAVAPIVKRQRFGKIITVSSVAGTTWSADGGYEGRIASPRAVHASRSYPPG